VHLSLCAATHFLDAGRSPSQGKTLNAIRLPAMWRVGVAKDFTSPVTPSIVQVL
jgi:hypothetical protein